jgi:hypothetical protein
VPKTAISCEKSGHDGTNRYHPMVTVTEPVQSQRRNGTKKRHEFIKPGGSTSFTAGTGGRAGRATLSILFHPEQEAKAEACSHVMNDRTARRRLMVDPGQVFVWKLPAGATRVCRNVTSTKVSFTKTFHKDKLQYHTVFTMEDLK